MKRFCTWVGAVLWGVALSCHSNGSKDGSPGDTLYSGFIRISADESFRPVLEEEIKVFQSSHPEAHFEVSYKPEAGCLKDLQNDSTRMIFVTRGLTDEEMAYYRSKLQYNPSYSVLAYDAVAVIVNSASPDTNLTTSEISDILQGGKNGAKPYTAVFDGLNATSTIRFALDSILKGSTFDPSHVFAAENSTGVIKYVESHPDAIGFVGVSWIGNPEDTLQDAYRKEVRIASIRCDLCPDKAYTYPSQEDILTFRYPFTRGLYYIKKENYDGLATGLVDFLGYERGQLIFRRAYLVPAIMPFNVRDAQVR
jgi:phosphate transport system substrate-binding protein